MISFIIPAHNEQANLPRTLRAIHAAAQAAGSQYEVIVVDDASTDATAEIARANNARVLAVNHRQIAATRNSGGRAAAGEQLFFVDADTVINAGVVASALRAMERGAVGGGAPARFNAGAPLYAQVLMFWCGLVARLPGLTGGAFLFCTSDAFRKSGGFDERLFGAEDAAMSWELKRHGRFVVLWRYVTTSARRLRGFRGPRILLTLLFSAFVPGTLRTRARVKKIWYESNREQDESTDSIAIRLFNAAMLFFVLALVVPFWGSVIPWSWTPRESLSGRIRLAVIIINCHIAMVLWPCAYLLARWLPRQTRWWERMRIIVLMAVCVWGGWSMAPVVIWFWKEVLKRVAGVAG